MLNLSIENIETNMIQISQCIFLLISLRRVFSEYQRGFGGCEFSASHLQYHNVRSVMTSASIVTIYPQVSHLKQQLQSRVSGLVLAPWDDNYEAFR